MTDLRYAIYAVPVFGHPSWTLAADWLGRDPEGGAVATGNRPDWLSAERWQDVTADARHYGFHGTMKPPFALHERRDGADLDASIATFAASQPPLAPAMAPATGLATTSMIDTVAWWRYQKLGPYRRCCAALCSASAVQATGSSR